MKKLLATIILILTVFAGTASAQATKISTGGTLPTSCTIGNVYVKTGTSAGWYTCLATNTWTGPYPTSSGGTGDVTHTGSLTSGQLIVGNGTADLKVGNLSGDISTSGSAVTAIGASKVTNTMLAGSIAASKLVGTDIATVGTITTGTWSAATIAVAKGGTGLTSGTSGGILGYTASGTLASSIALTANMPVIGGGAGATPTVGTVSGNTTKFVTAGAGSPATNDCAKFDADGNIVTAGAACAAGSGSVSSVDMTVPSFLSVSGNPITTSGTLAVTLSGTALPFANGGTGLTSASDDQVMVSSGSAWVAKTITDCTDTGGNHINYTQSTNTFSCGSTVGGGGSPAISTLTAATGSNTIASGNNLAQIWNWAPTSTGYAFTFGETTAATGGNSTGNQGILKAATLASSTAVPLIVDNFGAGYSLLVNDVSGDTTPFLIDASGNVVVGSGSVKSGAGVAATFAATDPTQTTGAQAGVGTTLAASNATVGSSTVGGAAGGTLTLTAGNGVALTSGVTGAGGPISITAGTGAVPSGNFFAVGGAITITGGTAAAGDAAQSSSIGGAVTVKGGASASIATGGTLNLQGGTAANGAGGPVVITAANASGGNGGAGGLISLTTGNGSGGTNAGGAFTITTGTGNNTSSSNSGTVSLSTGNGKQAATAITIQPGQGGVGINANPGTAGGATSIYGGSGQNVNAFSGPAAGGAGAALNLTGGDGGTVIGGASPGAGGAGGNVNIIAGIGGTSTGAAGTGGSIVMKTAATTRVTISATGTVTISDLTTTGSAGSKKVVCVDTSTGQLYASSTGVDCSN